MKEKKSRTAYQKEYREEYSTHNKRVNITVSNSEYRAFKALADTEKTKVSTLVKDMATAYMQQKTFVPKEINEELKELKLLIRNVANNVNQVAHHSNIINGLVNENDLLEELRRLETMVNDYTLKQLKESNDY